MKDKDEFLKQMENLELPKIEPPANQDVIKMTIMNAERSAALGVWLVVVPCYFLFCVFMYYYFHRSISWFGAMVALMSGLNKNPYIDFMAPIVLVVLPIACIIINALSITHIGFQKIDVHRKKVSEFNISVRLKFWNILLILISIAVVCIFIAFVTTESISIKN